MDEGKIMKMKYYFMDIVKIINETSSYLLELNPPMLIAPLNYYEIIVKRLKKKGFNIIDNTWLERNKL